MRIPDPILEQFGFKFGKKGAGILRAKPNAHWKKNRGKDVASATWFEKFGGDRINDHHLTLAEKQDAKK